MTDDRTKQALAQLNDTYEDQLFRIAVGDITADAEGKALLAGIAAEAPETPSPEALRRFAANVDRYIRRSSALDCRQDRRRRKVWSKAAVVLLAAIALFALLMVSVSAFRTRVLNLLMKMEPKYTSVQLTDDAAATAGSGLTLNWKQAYVPTYIPEGYEVSGISNSETQKIVSFIDPKTSATLIYREYASQNMVLLDTEDADLVKQLKIGGGNGTLVVKDSIVTVAWVLDGHLFMVVGPISEDTAVKIADSVKFIP